MKLKKKIFHPKRVRFTKDEKQHLAKDPHGGRFGHRWFPYNRPQAR